MRERIRQLVEHPRFSQTIVAVIVINAIVLGLETSPEIMRKWGTLLHAIDLAFIAVFVTELGLKFVAYRWRFFGSGWNIFDFVIVVVTLLPFLGNLSVLRALRILRVLRLFSMVPRFRLVAEGFFAALSGMAAVGGMLVLVLYIAAVLSTKLFGTEFPELFGTLGRSLFSMFQLVTLEGWTSEIVRPVMAVYPLAWLFFVPFIAVTTFTIFNLLIGVIVNSMQDIHAKEEERLRQEIEETEDDIVRKIERVERTLDEIKSALREPRRP